MIVHPKIENFINCIREGGYDIANRKEEALNVLWSIGATATEAAITLHLGFNYPLAEAEKLIRSSQLWEPETIQDIAYQTFLYMNYNPDDPNFSYDEDKVKFPLTPPSKNKD